LRPGDINVRLLAARTARRQSDFAAAQKHLETYRQHNGSARNIELENLLMRVQDGDQLRESDTVLAAWNAKPDETDAHLLLEVAIVGKLNLLEAAIGADLDEEPLASHRRAAKRAIDVWQSRRTGAADQVQGLVWRGWLCLVEQDYPYACAHLKEALRRDPDHFTARLKLAPAIVGDSPAEAEFHLAILHRRDPHNNHVRFALATVRRGLGRLDEAANLLDEMLAAHPNNVQALLERGAVALDALKPADAERWFRQAWQIAPNLPETNLAMSRCLQLTGKEPDAKPFRDRFLQLDAELNKGKHKGVPKGSGTPRP
jgi:tetratricopeptide (TPR) repeat protein